MGIRIIGNKNNKLIDNEWLNENNLCRFKLRCKYFGYQHVKILNSSRNDTIAKGFRSGTHYNELMNHSKPSRCFCLGTIVFHKNHKP